MLVRYLVGLREPINLEDHWPISIMGGDLRAVSKNKKVIAFEITFSGQSVQLAPAVETHEEADIKLTIAGRDRLLPVVKMQLEDAFAYLQCYCDVEILISEIEAKYSGETEEEENQIKIKSLKSKREKHPLVLPYDLFTRAIMAAETGKAPKLEANFLRMAQTEMLQERYIDSFRSSFLLIEALYGDGKYRAAQLKNTLKASAEFVSIVTNALKERMPARHHRNSDTEKLLSAFPKAEAVIDHLVEKRGFYFHGNVKRKNAWRPHEQEMAEALCLLSLNIAMLISQAAAAPMFDDSLSQRHLDNAKRVGAIMTLNVTYRFHDLSRNFNKKENITFDIPGTKVTPRMAVFVAKEFLNRFEDIAPIGELKSATCIVAGTGQEIFDIEFHVKHS